jgi:hypothetical protein
MQSEQRPPFYRPVDVEQRNRVRTLGKIPPGIRAAMADDNACSAQRSQHAADDDGIRRYTGCDLIRSNRIRPLLLGRNHVGKYMDSDGHAAVCTHRGVIVTYVVTSLSSGCQYDLGPARGVPLQSQHPRPDLAEVHTLWPRWRQFAILVLTSWLAACSTASSGDAGQALGDGISGECDAPPDSSRPQYIIGYGSLMQDESRKRTSPRAGPAHPVEVRGYRRGWSHGVPPRSV